MSGYDPKDSEEKSVFKAFCFYKSMIKNGQDKNIAILFHLKLRLILISTISISLFTTI